MDDFIELTTDQLKNLKVKYYVGYPLHLPTMTTIDIFVERFQKYPEWHERVKFLSYQDDWKTCGSFIVILDQKRVFFNTLENFPHPKLKFALITYEFEDKITFINIRDGLRHVLLESIRIHHFNIVTDIGARTIIFHKDFLRLINLDIPEGFYLGPLRQEHVEKINNAWKGKFDGSKKLISEAIALNTSMGIYYQLDGNLVGWNMRLDTGAMSVGGIDKNYEGHRLGRIAILGLAKEISEKFNTDVFFEVVNGNDLALTMIRNLPVIDTSSWINVLRKKVVGYSIWGHL